MVYFIPTPIGNLQDISHRSLKVLMRANFIFCEDTRNTKTLLSLLEKTYNLKSEKKTFISFHSHNEDEVLSSLNVNELKQNDYAFVSDAGMPAISDPGAKLVRFCQDNGIEYEVYAGANALLLAYASSGFLDTEFSFFGFLPHKGADREAKLNELMNSKQNAVVYESPHRIEKLLNSLASRDPEREVFVIKEATKKFETKFFGSCEELAKKLSQANTKGEWVVVVKKSIENTKASAISEKDILSLSLKPKEKAKLLAKITGKSVNECYEKLIKG